jgi:hypothetical protein
MKPERLRRSPFTQNQLSIMLDKVEVSHISSEAIFHFCYLQKHRGMRMVKVTI